MKKLLLILSLAVGITAFSQVPSYVPTNGLVGWWPFNGNANDLSGNGNNGVVNGATLTTDRNALTNSAFSFISNEIYIPFNSSFNSTNISVSAWINPTNYGSPGQGAAIVHRYQFGYANPNGEVFRFMLSQDNLGYIKPEISSISQTTLFNAPSIMTLNTWNFVMFSFDGNSLKTFVNGSLAATTTDSSFLLNVSGNSGLSIGISNQANGLWYAFKGKIDDIGIWNRALDSCEVKDLYFGSLGNCCNISVSTQPINQSVNISNNAQFTTAASDPLATYQWQTDLGVGYLNLNSVGQYNGTTNDTLTISNTTLSNNNQPFRCIVSSGSCTDTSAVAVLTVVNNVGINEVSQSNIFTVYPNPTNSTLKINTKAIYSSIQIVNTLGQLVFTKEKSASLNVSSLPSGIYFIQLVDNKGSLIGKEKFVKD